MQKNHTRRQVLKGLGVAAGSLVIASRSSSAKEGASSMHIASNQYSWTTFFQREGKDFLGDLDAGFAAVAAAGLNGFEGTLTDPAQVDQFAPLLKKHGLEMRSVYVNSTLHTPEEAAKSIEGILVLAEKLKTIGTRILVTNPNPIQWNGPENKTDEHLKVQAAALNTLGKKLSALGMTIAYHNHDIELRQAAHEFHHMMLGTDPKYVTLCLDAHWIYRGSGNSNIALFDVVKLYASRVSEVHLRQSANNVWTEAFGDGDIDYALLALRLAEAGVKPHLVMEQAPETGTPKTMDPVALHKQSVEYALRVLKPLAG